MPEEALNSLTFETTEALISELIRRHHGDGRALCLISCLPQDNGKLGEGELRTCFICRDKRLLSGIINKGFEMARKQALESEGEP